MTGESHHPALGVDAQRLGGSIHEVIEWRSAGGKLSHIGLERLAEVYVHLMTRSLSCSDMASNCGVPGFPDRGNRFVSPRSGMEPNIFSYRIL